MEDHNQNLSIVGIGASAGGVKALQTFFEALHTETDAAFVIIVHLDPEVPSELAAILANHTKMPVAQIDNTALLEGGHVYVIAPNRRLHIADHLVTALPLDEPRSQRAPIDWFFRSLADQHSNCYAVILTGAGTDGAIGVKAIKEAGGIVLVQDPEEAEYGSMPRSAIATQVADFVLPVRDLAKRLNELLAHHTQVPLLSPQEQNEDLLRRILAHVRIRTGHDFSQYKRATLLRRIARRAQVMRKESLADYYLYLRDNAEEAQALFGDFLISVTTFFRDPKAFATLVQTAIPQLFESKEAGSTIRVWVPGCATGEEAYTIGILLLEEASRHEIRPEIQVFGSDLDTGALAIAREGRFPATIETDLTEERLRRFFQREGDHYRVRRELRDIVLFANHSLLKDPPFSRLDMISCRNLLIYMDRELQQQVCNTFHYALNPGGFLFLGSSESAEQPSGLFRPIDREARLYRAVPTPNERRPALPILLSSYPIADRGPTTTRVPSHGGNIADAALHRQMLEKIAPPSMLVDMSHRAIHLSENAGRYLHLSGGPVSTDAADMVREEFRFDLRTALHRAFERGESTLSMPLVVRFNGVPHRVYLQVKPVVQDDDATAYALVLFIEGDSVEQEVTEEHNGTSRTHEPVNETIQQLQQELQLAQSRLRVTREESEATNEELRAANEELQSINEEYRSTSEELETSKEELQSINEELQTVNNELKLKLETVSRAHNDLQNLMSATDVGTLFLDPSLRIKRFTPRLTDLFNITAHDEGRPITDFTHQLDYDELADHARMVLRDLTPIEQEVKSRKGGWYLVRMRPYRTIDDKIEGVVATFVDITERLRAEEALRESEEHLRQEMRLVELSRAPIFVWDFDNGIVQWNRGCEQLYGYSREEAIGKRKESLLKTIVPGSSFEALRQSLLENGSWSGELFHTAKNGNVLSVESQIELVSLGGRRLVLESTWDLTERKRWEQRRQLLLDELTHRMKNTLTVIQSIAHQTLRTTTSGADFVERFEGRLHALANAHKLLVESRWEGAELGALAQGQLEAYIGNDSGKLRIEGESVILPPEIATPFGLVLHELATNAVKYGALSAPTGRVVLSWTLSARGDRKYLSVNWKECDGPRVVAPENRGFGGILIENGVPGATVKRNFLPEGVTCTIDLELPEIQWNGSHD
ncbi:chemotaxis protein CheB [Beijerinckia indica]|uniref:Blue-light-activated histidine kinase n=1 Tax=Beijerinckia indica subsp. indica (strain ATCC 9039 / DSM 1715 / NCIMB 8712) TaxID=395963 RepID=B2ILH0_BEII9|nr:chemotaxis protein CheB [Beijerinckia indica]ACB97368.1 MCP methyltransferase/methylesterase, CheR/CheB with PAS/PAC sensor [Beijerinckia indica subsp. indica ATCC 9039]